MGDVEAAPRSSFTPVAPLAWSKLVPDVDLPDLGGNYQNLGRAHAQVLSGSAKELSLRPKRAADAYFLRNRSS